MIYNTINLTHISTIITIAMNEEFNIIETIFDEMLLVDKDRF